ncbi:SET domain-containing protein 8 [Trichoderma asperellum]|uniref:SET domain-containing protein 8 n=1 Tax=Trichoderma asperellum TaxID=101201 RepID=A0A6V8QUG0_TRIAP|nr:SET domain-containing protein 8 [Trichoderma asperellum]
MAASQLPIEALPAWALLNDVEFTSAEVRSIDGKGLGLVAKNNIPGVSDDASNTAAIIRIPRELVLSAEAVEAYAKVDQNFRQLLEVAGHQSSVNAKLSVLSREYDELSEKASALPFWSDLLGEAGMMEDWILADALYRSRCLELPHAGHAMVPGLDMANHSPNYLARYDETPDGDVVLLPSSESGVSSGEEITISYGEAKSAAEMLFSYGFIDQVSAVKELALHLDALPDDPLGKAKLHIYKGPRTVQLSLTGGDFYWHSPLLYLLILNEEDGLAFRVVQDTSGGRELRLLWQDEDVTGRTGEFESLIQDHPLCQIFKLRAVAVLEERVSSQLDRITAKISYGATEQSQAANQPRVECMLAAEKLRDLEAQILQGAAAALENEKARLLLDARVVTYLGSMEDTQNEQASNQASNEDDEFS